MADPKDENDDDTLPAAEDSDASTPSEETDEASPEETVETSLDASDETFIEDTEETVELSPEAAEELAAAFDAPKSDTVTSDETITDEESPDPEGAELTSESDEPEGDTADRDRAEPDGEEVAAEAVTPPTEDDPPNGKADGSASGDVAVASDTDAEPVFKHEDAEASAGEPEPAPTPIPPAPPPEKKRGGFGLVLGGIIAAALGAGAVYFLNERGMIGGATGVEERLAEQAGAIASLRDALATATERNTVLEAALADLAATSSAGDTEATGEVERLAGLLDDLNARLSSVEVQPIPDVELPQQVRDAFDRQLQQVLTSIEGRFAELETGKSDLMANLRSEVTRRLDALDAAQAETSAIERAAVEKANRAAALTAVTRVKLALDTGEPFSDQLATVADLGGVAIPDSLSALAESGSVPLNVLRDEFARTAREVLTRVDRDAGAEGSVGPLSSLLLSTLGARSLEPREGNDPDAIMSRAEAALDAGDLDTTLTELTALPDAAQTIFADWVSRAEALRTARAAAVAISEELSNE